MYQVQLGHLNAVVSMSASCCRVHKKTRSKSSCTDLRYEVNAVFIGFRAPTSMKAAPPRQSLQALELFRSSQSRRRSGTFQMMESFGNVMQMQLAKLREAPNLGS